MYMYNERNEIITVTIHYLGKDSHNYDKTPVRVRVPTTQLWTVIVVRKSTSGQVTVCRLDLFRFNFRVE